jgi:hypothetical protein
VHPSELTPEVLKAYLKSTNHTYNTTHTILCFAIIKRIHRRVLMGYRFGAISVCYSKGLIIDGIMMIFFAFYLYI